MSHSRWTMVFVGLLLFGAGAVAPAAPRLSMPRTVWDFGGVAPGKPAECRFTLLNRGDAPLHILDVKSSCSTCLELDKKTIPPGEGASLTAILKASGGAGPFRERIRLRTDDPRHPAVSLELRGRFLTLWRLDPGPVLELGGCAPGRSREWTYRLRLTSGEPWTLREIRLPPGFGVEATPDETASVYTLHIRYDGSPLSTLPLRGRMLVVTDRKEAARLFIPFVVWGGSRLIAVPRSLVLRPAPRGGYRGVLRVLDAAGAAFEITRVLPPSEEFRVTWLPGARAGHRLVVTFSGKAAAEAEAGTIRIETGRGDVLDVPARFSGAAPVVARAVKHQSLYPPEIAVRAAETVCGCAASRAAAGVLAGNPSAELLVWTAGRLAEREPERRRLRRLLGGMSLTRFARTREKVRVRMRRDPAFSDRCRTLIQQAREEADRLSANP